MLIVKNQNDGIEELIVEFENSIGYELPVEFMSFLKKYNGGETPNTSVNFNGISSDIRAFYGLGNVKYNFSKISCVKEDEKMLLPIAEDSFGNYFAIGLAGDDGIYFIDHEKESGVLRVDESFLGFVNKCKSEEISPLSKRTPKEREEALIRKGKGGNITDGLRKMWQAEYDKYKNICQEEVIM